ncbi:tryptophan 7-halogenase [Sphingomonas sp. ASV193]|uniref:tryptophan 7-halogenase n=1 Tax=Sphingomonas sp. ASV193 TaxID=3144405 RepID=UPI0032E885C2
MTDRPIETLLVVGRDVAGFVAAAALHRALGPAGIRVEMVELPSRAGPGDVLAAPPSIGALHRMIGLDERLPAALCGAVPLVAHRYANWGGAAAPFFHGFDLPPLPGQDLPFTQYWLKGRREGLQVALEDFSFAIGAARSGRVPVPPSEPAEPAVAAFGWSIDLARYVAVLDEHARRSGVVIHSARSIEVEHRGEMVEAIRLDDGRRLAADLYLDATGPEASLIGSLAGSVSEDWSDRLPCDRVMTLSGHAFAEPPAYGHVAAFDAGYLAVHPLQHRTAVSVRYSSEQIDDAALAAQLPALSPVPLAGDADVAARPTGRRGRPWIGNCVALGEAAVVHEALDGAPIQALHAALAHLLTLLPVTTSTMPEAAVFNRLVGLANDGLRDFTAAHFALNRRFGQPLWDAVRQAFSPTLADKVRLFSMRGLVPINDEEPFDEGNWSLLLTGHGIEPEGYDPRIDIVDDEAHVARVNGRLQEVAARVRAMPTMRAAIAAMMPSMPGGLNPR